MRTFVTVGHTASAAGDWRLDDLAGSGGRIDVFCRNIQAALFLSHGLRHDTTAVSLFATGEKAVRMDGGRIQMLHPDERSTAARLQQALRDPWSVPDWKEVQKGLAVARFDLGDLLDDLIPAHAGAPDRIPKALAPSDLAPPNLAPTKAPTNLVLLDPDGTPIESWSPPMHPVFLLSDHIPFTAAEYKLLDARQASRVSLGPHWYHGNHAIAVVQWWLDRHAQAAGLPGTSS